MATDSQVLVAAARWADESAYLKDLSGKLDFPAVVKIVKGQYGGLGVPTLPSPSLQSTALLMSAGRRNKIIAQAIKLKEGRRVVGIGPRIAIPDSYPGYFELLSEEGRAMRCIESVLELAKRRPESGCLVREPIRCIHGKTDLNGTLTGEGTRVLAPGEIIFPSSEVQINGQKSKLLQCVDSKGDILLLSLDQRGKFSILAKEDNISGVHTAKNLFSKRMPITVRLVYGPPPRGLKSSSHFVPELRLLATYQEEHVFALPLQKESNAVIVLPLSAPIKIQKTRNPDHLKSLKEFQRLTDKCSLLIQEVADHAHVLDGKLYDAKFLTTTTTDSSQRYHSKGAHSQKKNTNAENQGQNHSILHSNENRVPTYLSADYDDIDQIYDYVRGFAPLPKNIRSPFSEPLPNSGSKVNSSVPGLDSGKPEPPPIETIPSKKLETSLTKAEKRTRKETVHLPPGTPKDRHSIPSIFVKNTNSQRARVLRQKSSSPSKEHPPPFNKLDSPLHSIRYKSLNNLQQTMDFDGTLDSSHSGGRTSGDSGTVAKLPEKRSRRLSRPLSLTNLVWDLRRESCKSTESSRCHHKVSSNKTPIGHNSKKIGTLYL